MNQYGDEYVPRKRSRAGVYFIFLLLWIAIGGGAYAWYERTRGQQTRAELDAATADLASVKTQKTANEKKLGELQTERDKLSGADSELRDTKAQLAAAESRLRDLEEQRAEVDARLAEFREVTEKFKKLIDAGTLEITFRRGRMIVELPAGVLFDSGSADLSDEGKKAVVEVARVLASVRGRRFIVGGHTDNVPAVKEYKSNWALSTARAVTVLEALMRAGMDPTRLVAAGYAEFDPVSSNASNEGRQKNRRIEIILEPYLVAPPDEKPAAKVAKSKG
jgi:chemotaxis protein MotB